MGTHSTEAIPGQASQNIGIVYIMGTPGTEVIQYTEKQQNRSVVIGPLVRQVVRAGLWLASGHL